MIIIFEDIDIQHLSTKNDLETAVSKLKADLIQFMFLQALGIVGLTVTLVKIL